ncbi:MAG: DUF4349 domain-containing protein [Planctomycetes bacterium]|nr:DUF4349 domain-containing protein [Planctomycetota bacterium]
MRTIRCAALAALLFALAGCSVPVWSSAEGVPSAPAQERALLDDGMTAKLVPKSGVSNLRSALRPADRPDGTQGSQGPATKQSGLSHDPAQAPADSVAPEPTAPDRQVIYSADYAIAVRSVEDSITKLLAAVKELGGYLAEREDSRVTVRVPGGEFHKFISSLRSYGGVLRESMTARDVTAEHTDLKIRLDNALKARQRLLALLEKAAQTKDLLEIEAALRGLTTEIERMQGQLKLLEHQVAMSTVRVEFHSNAPRSSGRRRARSRFGWINTLGIDRDLRRF